MAAIIGSAPRQPALPPEGRSEHNRIRRCTAMAWVQLDLEGGLCRFRSFSEAPIIEGLLHLICLQLSGLSPAQVAASTLDPIAELDLHRFLSPTRIAGVAAALAHMKALASTATPAHDTPSDAAP